MRVLFTASESTPFAKTGGLGDVIGSLPRELKNKGVDVRVMIPKYKNIPEHLKKQMKLISSFTVKVGWRDQYCGVYELEYGGVKYYFIDNEYYFNRDGFYGFYDDGERFAFFSRAILDSLPYINFKPDIIHLNDWHTAVTSVLLREQYMSNPFYSSIKTFFSIHNLKYQGIFPKTVLNELLDVSENLFTVDKLEFYGNVNYMKGALVYSDIVSTVSETYAEEIQYDFFGEGLDGVLKTRKNDLYGILNGIDYDIYNPAIDPYLYCNYSKSTGKCIENKKKLQKLLNLPVREDVPIIAIISRLVEGKGMELVTAMIDEMLSMDIQLVVLGTGDIKYEYMFRNVANKYKDKVSINIIFDDALAHKIYAGADFLLMPSVYEPCGLGQIIALRYGTIPIVRETGGLNDTVFHYNEFSNKGNGFSFKNINAHDMLYTIKRAISFYYDDKHWKSMIKNAMECDYSWNKSSKKYLTLYKYLLEKPIRI